MAVQVEMGPEILSEHGIETHGIERVPPSERRDMRIFDNFTMWLSANLVLSTVALGTLAVPIFQMGFWDSALAIVLFNILGVLPVAFFATLGPKLGLRQMTISRFAFGLSGGAVMALFNVAACIGWSAVNVIVGAQLITALSGGHVPAWAGILLIAALTTFISLYGYSYVHRYERIAWMPMAAIFFLLVFVAGPHAHLLKTPEFGIAELASFFSFGGAIYGFATGWSSYAADYNVNQPEETPPARVFWLTFLGCTIPCILLESSGPGAVHGVQGRGGGRPAGGGASAARRLRLLPAGPAGAVHRRQQHSERLQPGPVHAGAGPRLPERQPRRLDADRGGRLHRDRARGRPPREARRWRTSCCSSATGSPPGLSS